MLDKAITYLQFGNIFCGIEYTVNDMSDVFYISVLKRKKEELIISDSFETNSIGEIEKKLKNNQHIQLTINDNSVLTKKIKAEQIDTLKLVYKAFPNIKVDDFYFEVLSQNKTHFVSICRKDTINEIIEEFNSHKINVIGINLGNLTLSNTKDFITDTTVYTSNSKITLTNHLIENIEKSVSENVSYSVNGLTISSPYLLACSGAIKSVLKNNQTQTNFSSREKALLKTYNHKRFYNEFLKFAGILILVSLLINAFVFNDYHDKVSKLSEISQVNEIAKKQVISLNEIVLKKKKTVDDLLKSNSSKSSFFSNVIIQSLPESILLSELNYQPLLKKIRTEKAINLDSNTITISGISNKSAAFSNWISELENIEWISHVEIIDYADKHKDISEFELKLLLKDD